MRHVSSSRASSSPPPRCTCAPSNRPHTCLTATHPASPTATLTSPCRFLHKIVHLDRQGLLANDETRRPYGGSSLWEHGCFPAVSIGPTSQSSRGGEPTTETNTSLASTPQLVHSSVRRLILFPDRTPGCKLTVRVAPLNLSQRLRNRACSRDIIRPGPLCPRHSNSWGLNRAGKDIRVCCPPFLLRFKNQNRFPSCAHFLCTGKIRVLAKA